MKLNHKINIDLLEFFKTGKFDYLKLGQTREWILNNFPDPEDWLAGENNFNDSAVWRYGNLELHFDKEDRLFMIFSNYLDFLHGGKSIKLDKWILNKPKNLRLQKIIKEFNKLKIDFSIKHKEKIECVELQITESNVILSFFIDYKKDVNQYKLDSFCLRQDYSEVAQNK